MSLVRGNLVLFSGLWFISCSIEENGLPRRFTPRNDRLVLAGRVDFYIVLYYRRRDGTEAVPYNYIYSTLCLFPSARISTLVPPQSALRLEAPLRVAPLRGKDFGLAWPRCPLQNTHGKLCSFPCIHSFTLSRKTRPCRGIRRSRTAPPRCAAADCTSPRDPYARVRRSLSAPR